MAEETKVEETTKQDATVEKVDTEVVDYDKELEEAATKTRNQIGYETRHKKDVVEEEDDDSKPLTKKDLDQVVATLKESADSNALEAKLDKVAGNNESLKKLVKFHYENSVNPKLDMTSRVEAAYAIANKKLVDKTVKEINIAQQNRSQISNVGQGTNSETHQKPGNNILSDSQLNELKALGTKYGFSGKTLDKFVEDSVKRMSQ